MIWGYLFFGNPHISTYDIDILRCFQDFPPPKQKTRRPSSKKKHLQIFCEMSHGKPNPRDPKKTVEILRSFSAQVRDPPSHVNAGLHQRCTSKHDGSPVRSKCSEHSDLETQPKKRYLKGTISIIYIFFLKYMYICKYIYIYTTYVSKFTYCSKTSKNHQSYSAG